MACKEIFGGNRFFRHLHKFECMGGQVYTDTYFAVFKVDSREYQFILCFAEKYVLSLQMTVDIHKVEEKSIFNGLLLIGNGKDTSMNISKSLFLVAQVVPGRSAQGIDIPVVEDSGSAVSSAESFLVHSFFSIFLSGIEHERIALHECGCYHGRYGFGAVACKKITGNALLIVVFQEVEHVTVDVIHALPGLGDG